MYNDHRVTKAVIVCEFTYGYGLMPPQVCLDVRPQGESASVPEPPEQPCSGQDGFRHSLVLRVRYLSLSSPND
jgi:hypothetical protein